MKISILKDYLMEFSMSKLLEIEFFERIIDKIDGWSPGFYGLFMSKWDIRFRVANWILHDDLRWAAIHVRQMHDKVTSYPIEVNSVLLKEMRWAHKHLINNICNLT